MNRILFYHSLWVFLWPILFSPISSDAQDKLRVGLSSVSATSGSIWVAEEKGLFKKHGIDAEVIVIGGGASRVVSSLIAGEIQFSVGGGDSVIRSSLRGAGREKKSLFAKISSCKYLISLRRNLQI